jgi:hypothetical protein
MTGSLHTILPKSLSTCYHPFLPGFRAQLPGSTSPITRPSSAHSAQYPASHFKLKPLSLQLPFLEEIAAFYRLFLCLYSPCRSAALPSDRSARPLPHGGAPRTRGDCAGGARACGRARAHRRRLVFRASGHGRLHHHRHRRQPYAPHRSSVAGCASKFQGLELTNLGLRFEA